MQFRSLRNVALIACTAVLISCGSTATTSSVRVAPTPQAVAVSKDARKSNAIIRGNAAIAVSPNVWAAGDLTVLRSALVFVASIPAQPPESTTTLIPPPEVQVVAGSGSLWQCIAIAETGGNWSMHGSTYSTAFGMVNAIIFEYGTPDEQKHVFAGTATPDEQIDIASRFAAQHGFGGWGQLTKRKCGL